MKKKTKKFIGIILLTAIIVILGCFIAYKVIESQEKFCKGVDIIFFPGGPPAGSFSSIVYNGAQMAQKNLGANVEYLWSDWSTEKMISQFKEAINKSPDAICIMGHPGEEALTPLINEAEKRGIIVTSQNVDMPNIRNNYFYASRGFGYVGQDLYNSGLILSRGVLFRNDLEKGDTALVFGLLSEEGRGVRTKGCIDGLEEGGLNVHHINITPEVNKNADSEEGREFFRKALEEYPDTKLIITDHGGLTSATPGILKELGKEPGEIIIAGFDLSKKTLQGIREGYISVVHDQQPFLQGYLPILQACLTKKYGFAGMYIDTGIGLVDKINVKKVSELVEMGIR